MGMDNSLYKKTYFDFDYFSDEHYDFIQPECKITYNKNDKLQEKYKNKIFRPSYIDEEICYWRKSYQFHHYFVQKFANGVDDMRPIYVNFKDLKDLYDKCKKIYDTSIEDGINLNDEDLFDMNMRDKKWVKVAEKELPNPFTNIWFDYNSTYLYQIKCFIDCFEKLDKDGEYNDYVTFYYEASY